MFSRLARASGVAGCSLAPIGTKFVASAASLPPLFDVLRVSSLVKSSNTDLLEYLKNRNLNKLAFLAEQRNLVGLDFVASLDELRQECSEEMKTLAGVFRADISGKKRPSLLDFTQGTTFAGTEKPITPSSGHYYVDRRCRVKIAGLVEEVGGFFLLHGPRSSGKSTLMLRLMEELDPRSFVFGELRLPSQENFQADLWTEMMTQLSIPNSTASPEVRLAAAAYLDPPRRESDNPFLHLLSRGYGGRKLVLFWDDFDSAYHRSRRKTAFEALGAVRRGVNQKSLPHFQAMVCFGVHSDNLQTAVGNSLFIPEKIFDHSLLRFTQRETADLFRQFQRESGVRVPDAVVSSIHELTGGHPGLTNLCGRFILGQGGGDFDLGRWTASFPEVLKAISRDPVYFRMMDGIRLVREPKATLELLRRLCYGPGEPMDFPAPFANLQHLGFAKTQRRKKQTMLVIQSPLLRGLAVHHMVHDQPAFTEVPMVAGKDGVVNVVELLKAAVRHFDPVIIRSSFETKCKEHDSTRVRVPSEKVYQFQLQRVITKALLNNPRWRFEFEAKGPGKFKPRINFLLVRQPPPVVSPPRFPQPPTPPIRVGFTMSASGQKAVFEEHASRPYPKTFQLSQHFVVHFSFGRPRSGFRHFFLWGMNDRGEDDLVPVYHVLHDREFQQVHLFYAPSPEARVPVVETILGDDYPGVLGKVVIPTRKPGQTG